MKWLNKQKWLCSRLSVASRGSSKSGKKGGKNAGSGGVMAKYVFEPLINFIRDLKWNNFFWKKIGDSNKAKIRVAEYSTILFQ